MEKLKLIERNTHFIIGEQSKKWRISPKYYTGFRSQLERYTIKDETLSQKFKDTFRVNTYKKENVGKNLYNSLLSMRVYEELIDEKRMYE
jgi:hypothetical protein